MAIGKVGYGQISLIQAVSGKHLDGGYVGEQDDPAFRERALRLVQNRPTRIDQSPAARELRESTVKRIREMSKGLKYLDAQLNMLYFGLSKSKIIDLRQGREEIKKISEMLNYYEVETIDIEKQISENNVDKGYVLVFEGLKITKADIGRDLSRLAQELEQRYTELAKLREIEERLYIIETATSANELIGADIELQIIFVELVSLGKTSDLYGVKRRELFRKAQRMMNVQ